MVDTPPSGSIHSPEIDAATQSPPVLETLEQCDESVPSTAPCLLPAAGPDESANSLHTTSETVNVIAPHDSDSQLVQPTEEEFAAMEQTGVTDLPVSLGDHLSIRDPSVQSVSSPSPSPVPAPEDERPEIVPIETVKVPTPLPSPFPSPRPSPSIPHTVSHTVSQESLRSAHIPPVDPSEGQGTTVAEIDTVEIGSDEEDGSEQSEDHPFTPSTSAQVPESPIGPAGPAEDANVLFTSPDLVDCIRGMYRIMELTSEEDGGRPLISQESVGRFMNELVPGSFTSLTEVSFAALDRILVNPVGIYGSRSEIIRFLRDVKAINDQVFVPTFCFSHTRSNLPIQGQYVVFLSRQTSGSHGIDVTFGIVFPHFG